MSDKRRGKSGDVSGSAYVASKNVVSRKNQDGSVILMKLDETSFFFKLDGIAADVWSDLQTPKTTDGLLEHYTKLWSSKAAALKTDLKSLLDTLLKKDLIEKTDDTKKIDKDFQQSSAPKGATYKFGGINEFNLEEIESEVLNESVYLDVFAGSDVRLKSDIEPIRGALAKIAALEGVNFRWNRARVQATGRKLAKSDLDVNTRAKQAGLLAQQVAEHMPELVRLDKVTGVLTVNYAKMTAYLVEAIKEMNSRMLQLESQLAKKSGRKSAPKKTKKKKSKIKK